MSEDGIIDFSSLIEGTDPTDPKYWRTKPPPPTDPYRTLSGGRVINIVDPFDPINKGEHPGLLAIADRGGLFGNYFKKKD